MKYKIKVGNKYLVGENANETLKGTVRGDTTAVYSRFVGEMSAYDFSDNIEDADAKDAVTACDYVRGIMERQSYGFYMGEIKIVDADDEETVAHCNLEENAKIIAHIMEFDSKNMVYDWYEQHIQQILNGDADIRDRAMKLANEITTLVDSTLDWSEVEGLIGKRAAKLANDICHFEPPKEET